MTKKPENALQAVLDRQAIPAPAESEPSASVAPEEPASARRPSREGKRLVGGHFTPDVARQLKLIAAEEGTSIQALLEEALDLLFVKKGKGHIGNLGG